LATGLPKRAKNGNPFLKRKNIGLKNYFIKKIVIFISNIKSFILYAKMRNAKWTKSLVP
jgi:hypothetical protein